MKISTELCNINNLFKLPIGCVKFDDRLYWQGLLVRDINPWSTEDAQLLQLLSITESYDSDCLNKAKADFVQDKCAPTAVKIITKRLEAAGIDHTPEAAVLFAMSARHPGDSVMYAYTAALIQALSKKKITVSFLLSDVFAWGLPSEKAKDSAWDEQKLNNPQAQNLYSDNLVDNLSFWPGCEDLTALECARKLKGSLIPDDDTN